MTVSKDKLKELESAGKSAVQKLRLEKLEKGFPFMFNSNSLPKTMCYLEYPNGVIKIVTINESKDDYKIIRVLTKKEIFEVRNRYQLDLY